MSKKQPNNPNKKKKRQQSDPGYVDDDDALALALQLSMMDEMTHSEDIEKLFQNQEQIMSQQLDATASATSNTRKGLHKNNLDEKSGKRYKEFFPSGFQSSFEGQMGIIGLKEIQSQCSDEHDDIATLNTPILMAKKSSMRPSHASSQNNTQNMQKDATKNKHVNLYGKDSHHPNSNHNKDHHQHKDPTKPKHHKSHTNDSRCSQHDLMQHEISHLKHFSTTNLRPLPPKNKPPQQSNSLKNTTSNCSTSNTDPTQTPSVFQTILLNLPVQFQINYTPYPPPCLPAPTIQGVKLWSKNHNNAPTPCRICANTTCHTNPLQSSDFSSLSCDLLSLFHNISNSYCNDLIQSYFFYASNTSTSTTQKNTANTDSEFSMADYNDDHIPVWIKTLYRHVIGHSLSLLNNKNNATNIPQQHTHKYSHTSNNTSKVYHHDKFHPPTTNNTTIDIMTPQYFHNNHKNNNAPMTNNDHNLQLKSLHKSSTNTIMASWENIDSITLRHHVVECCICQQSSNIHVMMMTECLHHFCLDCLMMYRWSEQVSLDQSSAGSTSNTMQQGERSGLISNFNSIACPVCQAHIPGDFLLSLKPMLIANIYTAPLLESQCTQRIKSIESDDHSHQKDREFAEKIKKIMDFSVVRDAFKSQGGMGEIDPDDPFTTLGPDSPGNRPITPPSGSKKHESLQKDGNAQIQVHDGIEFTPSTLTPRPAIELFHPASCTNNPSNQASQSLALSLYKTCKNCHISTIAPQHPAIPDGVDTNINPIRFTIDTDNIFILLKLTVLLKKFDIFRQYLQFLDAIHAKISSIKQSFVSSYASQTNKTIKMERFMEESRENTINLNKINYISLHQFFHLPLIIYSHIDADISGKSEKSAQDNSLAIYHPSTLMYTYSPLEILTLETLTTSMMILNQCDSFIQLKLAQDVPIIYPGHSAIQSQLSALESKYHAFIAEYVEKEVVVNKLGIFKATKLLHGGGKKVSLELDLNINETAHLQGAWRKVSPTLEAPSTITPHPELPSTQPMNNLAANVKTKKDTNGAPDGPKEYTYTWIQWISEFKMNYQQYQQEVAKSRKGQKHVKKVEHVDETHPQHDEYEDYSVFSLNSEVIPSHHNDEHDQNKRQHTKPHTQLAANYTLQYYHPMLPSITVFSPSINIPIYDYLVQTHNIQTILAQKSKFTKPNQKQPLDKFALPHSIIVSPHYILRRKDQSIPAYQAPSHGNNRNISNMLNIIYTKVLQQDRVFTSLHAPIHYYIVPELISLPYLSDKTLTDDHIPLNPHTLSDIIIPQSLSFQASTMIGGNQSCTAHTNTTIDDFHSFVLDSTPTSCNTTNTNNNVYPTVYHDPSTTRNTSVITTTSLSAIAPSASTSSTASIPTMPSPYIKPSNVMHYTSTLPSSSTTLSFSFSQPASMTTPHQKMYYNIANHPLIHSLDVYTELVHEHQKQMEMKQLLKNQEQLSLNLIAMLQENDASSDIYEQKSHYAEIQKHNRQNKIKRDKVHIDEDFPSLSTPSIPVPSTTTTTTTTAATNTPKLTGVWGVKKQSRDTFSTGTADNVNVPKQEGKWGETGKLAHKLSKDHWKPL